MLETRASTTKIDREVPSGVELMAGPVLGDGDPEIKHSKMAVKKLRV